MTIRRTRPDVPEYENRSEAQEDLDASNRRLTLVRLITHARAHHLGAVGLLDLVEAVGLEEELLELAGQAEEHPERHRRLAAARQLQLQELGAGDDEVE